MSSGRPDPPPAVRWITRTLEEADYETWAVGGAVRDALRDHPSGDWDLATRARPRTVRKLFRRTVPIGIDHGTVGILARDGTMYEITTFRRDVQTDGRHAVVEFADTVEEDLARRDFTINAIAWHALREELFDPFGGEEDLRDGVLRTVGNPADRFREDYLRILRALRFAGRFELTIEDDTWQAARDLVGHLPELSPERIREELFKVLGDDRRPARSLDLYAGSGALRVLYPELDRLRDAPGRDEGGPTARPVAGGVAGSTWPGVLATLEHLPTGRPELRLAALLRPLEAEEVAAVLVRLRLSNRMTDDVALLAGAAPLPEPSAGPERFRRWLSRTGPERLNAVARLDLAAARAEIPIGVSPDGSRPWEEKADPSGTAARSPVEVVASWRRAREILRRSPPLEVSDLALDGRALISLGLKPGPRFGDIFDELLEWVLDDPARNERSRLEARALEIADDAEVAATEGKGG